MESDREPVRKIQTLEYNNDELFYVTEKLNEVIEIVNLLIQAHPKLNKENVRFRR